MINPMRDLGTLNGMKVVIAPEVPVLRLRDDFEWVGDRFRAEFNAWLLERFGTTTHVPKGRALIFDNTVIVRREDWAVIKASL